MVCVLAQDEVRITRPALCAAASADIRYPLVGLPTLRRMVDDDDCRVALRGVNVELVVNGGQALPPGVGVLFGVVGQQSVERIEDDQVVLACLALDDGCQLVKVPQSTSQGNYIQMAALENDPACLRYLRDSIRQRLGV